MLLMKISTEFNILQLGFCSLSIISVNSQDLFQYYFDKQNSSQEKMQDTNAMLRGDGSASSKNLKIFGIALIIYEAILVLFYGIFVRFLPGLISAQGYPPFLSSQVLLVVGFAMFRTIGKGYSFSVLLYTLFINAITLQAFMLFFPFASKVVTTGFHDENNNIYIGFEALTLGCGCVFAVLIAFSALLGRIGPKDILIMSQLCMIGYCFNTVICWDRIRVFDPAGTSYIHVYGTVFGLTASWILGRKIRPQRVPQLHQTTTVFCIIGTLFIWVFFPSFNSTLSPRSGYESFIIAMNTIEALIASCIATYAFSALMGRKIAMEDILNASLAGGVAIGIVSNVSYTPLNAIITGIIAGLVSTLGYHFLGPFFRDRAGVYDACGILNLHGIPGIVGGIISMIIVWTYNHGFDHFYATAFPFPNIWNQYYDTFWGQGFRQIAAILCSIVFGLLFGGVTGFLMSFLYNEDANAFYEDKQYIGVRGEKEGEPLMGV